MNIIKTKDRKAAYQAVINTALKDREIFEDTEAVINEVKRLRSLADNDHASFGKNAMRMALKLPRSLMDILDQYEESHGGKFLGSKEEVDWFAKNFPMFSVPRKY